MRNNSNPGSNSGPLGWFGRSESRKREVHVSLQNEANWPNTGSKTAHPGATRRFSVRRFLQRLGAVLLGRRAPPAQLDSSPPPVQAGPGGFKRPQRDVERAEQRRRAEICEALKLLLDAEPGRRRTLRHLFMVEQTLRAMGTAGLRDTPARMLRLALEQLNSVTDDLTYSVSEPLSRLREILRRESDSASGWEPSAGLGIDGLEVSTAATPSALSEFDRAWAAKQQTLHGEFLPTQAFEPEPADDPETDMFCPASGRMPLGPEVMEAHDLPPFQVRNVGLLEVELNTDLPSLNVPAPR